MFNDETDPARTGIKDCKVAGEPQQLQDTLTSRLDGATPHSRANDEDPVATGCGQRMRSRHHGRLLDDRRHLQRYRRDQTD